MNNDSKEKNQSTKPKPPKTYSYDDMVKAIEYGAWFYMHFKGTPSVDDKTEYLDKLHP